MKLGLGCTAILVASAVHALEPCAKVTDLFTTSKKSNSTFLISGDLAHQCLQSIPIKVPEAVSFIEDYRKYMPFQSTIDILKDPPAQSKSSPVDLMGGLDRILKKTKQNEYNGQFEFDSELLKLISSANDGHLQIKPCSTTAFTFTHEEPLVSVSSDGLKLPEVYTLGDAKLLAQRRSVSPVKLINGTDAIEYLERFSSNQEQQDPDARYNTLFPSLSRTKTPNGLWMKTPWWPGPSSVFEFKNGTKKRFETLATTDYTVLDVRNGSAMYDRTCLSRKTYSSSTLSAMSNSQTDLPGYPRTRMQRNDTSVSGYFSNQTALRDTAILSVPSFEPLPSGWSHFAKGFLRKATRQGKKNLLIDLSGNPGGAIVAGFGLFAELFPGKEMYLGSRLRSHESAHSLEKIFSHLNDSAAFAEGVDNANPFVYQAQVSPDQKHAFKSWHDLYRPHDVSGANFSSPFAVFNLTALSNNDTSPINGYGPIPLQPKRSAFAPENITIITDGYCASTCTTFVTLMKEQGVRSIAFGGRPRNAPMQAMGGVKGAQSVDMFDIRRYFNSAQQVISRSMRSRSPVLSTAGWKRWNETVVPDPNNLSLSLNYAGFNLRNAYGRGDDTTPLQFVYEAADCRRFFTVDNYLRQETVWDAAAKAMFGDGECVEGSN